MKKITAKIIRDWEYHHWERRLKSTRSEYLAFKINEFTKEKTDQNDAEIKNGEEYKES
jgi:hypothetical protein